MYSSDMVKMLIPNNYVTKLIGAEGCMIRELAARSGGAQIKILSDKQSEKSSGLQECVVTIAGSLANKQDAACLILEQIETFKNGGPILLSGKSINANLAQQVRNSVPIRDSGNMKSAKGFALGRFRRSESPETKHKSERSELARESSFDKSSRNATIPSSENRRRSRTRSRSRSRSGERAKYHNNSNSRVLYDSEAKDNEKVKTTHRHVYRYKAQNNLNPHRVKINIALVRDRALVPAPSRATRRSPLERNASDRPLLTKVNCAGATQGRRIGTIKTRIRTPTRARISLASTP
eukprot:TRINITY_DN3020_c0_g1_i8.p1 TRINITY_DN3020_c0_g1~~TRINITY_DN3020_c0_g1_i8.p1  ORF type:complete len:294 (-),score=29.70 TRINITY_DN3020_c0_g1_i8:619-1500(-)